MSEPLASVDDITAGLRQEGERLRRRTLWLTALPIAVGLLVLVTAGVGVRNLRLEGAVLEVRRDELQIVIGDMALQRTELDREIAAQRDLLDQFAAKLPADESKQIAQIQQAMNQAKRGDFAEAIQSYDRAIQSNDGNALVHRLRGEVYYADGQYEQAIASLGEALTRDPNDAEARYTLGLAEWSLGRQDAAVTETRRAFVGDPAVQSRALQDPRYLPIREYLDNRAGQQSSRDDEERAWIAKGLEAARAGNFTAAAEAYAGALAIQPRNWRVLNWQGYALYRDKAYDRAVASLERAAKEEPTEPEPHYNLALTLWRADRQDEARKALLRAYEVDPAYRQVAQRDPQSKALRASLPR